jgi:L-fucose isomerase-like protein
MPEPSLGVIVGNRDFFPKELVSAGRREILAVLKGMNIQAVVLNEKESNLGGVETYADGKRCADLFRANRDHIIGVLVTLPNFGDEKAIADTLRLAQLDVPVLVHAYPDDLEKMNVERRRDAFCGKVSVCNNLNQYGIPFSLTERHVVSPQDESFKNDVCKFVSVCRVVKGIRKARLGSIGARPGAFNTVRFSEKLLEATGISVSTIDLSDIFARASRLYDGDPRVRQRIEEIQAYAASGNTPPSSLLLMAKLAVIVSEWISSNELDATAFQCWSSIQQNYGINACTMMSMMSEGMIPSACEVDTAGELTMYAMQLASGSPSALVDWNNNYGKDPNKCVLFHCGNWAKSFLPQARIGTAAILGTVVGVENTYGALEGRTSGGPLTYGRITTDDAAGRIRAYVGEGTYTDDELNTFGARAVVEVPNLQKLMRHICRNGFEHHAVMNKSQTADVLAEAFENYLKWDVYYHERPGELTRAD